MLHSIPGGARWGDLVFEVSLGCSWQYNGLYFVYLSYLVNKEE